MENPTSSRHGQVLIGLLTLCAVALMAATGWYYFREKATTEAAAIRELASISEMKVTQIVNWRQERLGDGRALKSFAITRIATRALSKPSVEPADRAELLDTMKRLEQEFLYTGAALVDRNGSVLIESNVSPSDPSRIRELGKAAVRLKDVSLQDLYWDAKLGRPLMALSIPVQGLGAFIFTIDPERFLYPFVRMWPTPSATAETDLFRLEGDKALYLNNVRFKQGTALHYARPFRDIRYEEEFRADSNAMSKTADYRGVAVLGILRRIPESPWYLITKMDVAEVDAPVARLGWEMVWLIALIAIANATGAGLIWRDRQLRIYRESENHLRQVANETPAYLWMTAKGGENIFINRPLAEFLGTNKEVLDKDWRQYFHPEDAQRVFDKFFGCVALHAEFIDEHRLRRFDGEYRWFIGIGRPRFSAEKEFLGYAGSLFDITERKAAQDRSREIAELMEGQNRVLELIAQDAPLQSTLDALVRVIEALSSETLGSILLLDHDGVRLCHGAAPNLPEWYVKAIDGEPIGPVAGSCGTAAFRRQPVIVEDIAMDPLWENYRELALSHGLRACWSTPIFDERGAEGQNVLGVFAFYFRSPRRPTPRHRELIEMATHTAAVAICRAREKQDLWKSEERLRLATGYGRLGVWEWQVDTNRIIWSEGVKSIFGWNQGADDLTYEKFVTAIHPDDRNWVVQAVRRALAKHADYDAEHRICLADGSVRWIASHGRAQYGPTDEPLRMLGVTQDITERKQAEEEIGRRDAQLVEAQRIAHVGSYEWDIQANKLYRSAELYNIFGLLPEEFAPTLEGYLERVHREDRDSTKKLIEQAFREGKPFDHEERIIRSDGRVRTLHSQGRVVCDDEGRPQTLVGICQDITDRKQAEHQLQTAYAALAEQLREKARAEKEIQALNARLITAQEEERSRLARELHDDFSQQIAGLSISLSNLRRGIPSEFAHVRSQSELIQERLTHLGEGIRRVSHELHPAMLEYSGLDTAIRAYCSEFAALGGIQVGFRSEGSFVDLPPEIALSAYRIAQEALQNILKHAQTKQAEVTLTQSQDVVRLTVSDHGIGMDKTRMSGGLGLTSMRERARLVNGTVVFQTGPGQGTTVTLTIPVPATPCQKSKIAKARGS